MTATDPDVEATLARLEQHVTDLEAKLRYIREAATRGVMPGCRDCDLDTHTCGGCGRSHPHGESYCPECTHQDCYTPIPLRWRHVQPGDVVVLKDKLWEVTATDMQGQWAEAFVARGEKTHRADLDPDATVPVLVRHQEREALQTAREQLGATVVDRRV